MKLQRMLTSGIAGHCLAIVAGALLTFAFAPLQYYSLAILIPPLLYGLWQGLTPGQAFKRGWWFGLGLFGAGVYWVFISIHTFGNASIYLAAFFTIGLIAILALFPAVTGYFLNRFFPNKTDERLFYAFPALWVVFEWIRSWIFTGFPWLLLGYSQINSPLKGYAALFGVYFVSLMTLVCGSLLFKTIFCLKQKNYKSGGKYFFIFVMILGIGGILNTISWTKPYGSPIQVSLVQGNIPQQVKWSPESIMPTLNTYRKLTETHWDSKIIIWPEAAIPLPMQNAESFLNLMDRQARIHNADFITGIPVQAPTGDSYYNAVIMMGTHSGFYLKHRLVPFGEYVPFKDAFNKLFDVLHIPMSDFISAPNVPVKPLEAGNIKIATFICYEIAFPELVLWNDGTINMLLTVSNDAWFGYSIAQAQHLEMAQMRAAEMGRPVLFVSNNGITAVINSKGQIQSKAPPYKTYVLTDKVQPMKGKTNWQRSGMDPVLYMLLLLILFSVRAEKRLKKNKTIQHEK